MGNFEFLNVLSINLYIDEAIVRKNNLNKQQNNKHIYGQQKIFIILN